MSVRSTGKTVQSMAQRIEATLDTLLIRCIHGVRALPEYEDGQSLAALLRLAVVSRLPTRAGLVDDRTGLLGRISRLATNASEQLEASSRMHPTRKGILY